MTTTTRTTLDLLDDASDPGCSVWRMALAEVLAAQEDELVDVSQTETNLDMLQQTYTTDMTISRDAFAEAMYDLYGISNPNQCRVIWDAWVERTERLQRGETENASDDDDENEVEGLDGDNDDNNDADELIGEGECELCERLIFLTRHHLIPRSTWPRLEGKLLQAAEALDSDTNKADKILGEEFEHLGPALQVVDTTNDHKNGSKKTTATTRSLPAQRRALVRNALQRTCHICRPCHSNVHNTHDNVTLAWQYNTMDKLLTCPKICKHAQWAHKQRVKGGKHHHSRLIAAQTV